MENSDIIEHLSILDLRKISNKNLDINSYGNAEIIELAEYFKLDEDNMLEEWMIYKKMFLNQIEVDSKNLSINKIYSTILKIEKVNSETYSLLKILLGIVCTLPVSNADVERIFSLIKLLLTD